MLDISIVIDTIATPFILSMAAAFVLNMMLNIYLIYSGLGRIFVMAVLSRLISSVVLIVTCLFFFQDSFLIVEKGHLFSTLFFSLVLSLISWLVNIRRVYTTHDYNNQAYLYHTPDDFTFRALECLSWMFYLLPYEFLLRGLMLSALLDKFSILEAFFINAFVYAFIHFHKGLRESLAALCFGFLLCAITLFTENFWSAFFIHLSLAVSNSFITIKRYSAT